MKIKTPIIGALLLCSFVLIPTISSAATNDLTSALQKGLFEEEANHNLEAAAAAYQNVSAQFDKDRKLAATAIFRLGEVYRKQGKTNEAAAQYERIVREFSDQQTLATLSRQNLVGLRQSPAASSDAPVISGSGNSAEEAKRLASQLAGLDQMKDDQEKQARAILAFFPDEELKKMLLHLPLLQKSEVQVKNGHRGFAISTYANGEVSYIGRSNPTNLAGAQEELRKQLGYIGERVDFILSNQKARLQALQSVAANSQARKVAADAQSVPTTDEEEKEIRRIQEIIRNSPDLINSPGEEFLTPLCRAARNAHTRVAKFLLENGAAVDQRSSAHADIFQGGTPLHFAANGGHRAMVELLLQHGADVNAPDEKYGYTPLHMAAAKGFQAVVEALIAGKADVKARNKSQQTPLHSAAAFNRSGPAGVLIAKGAEVNARDVAEQTPLLVAGGRGYVQLSKQLLDAGAEPNSADRQGRTALSYAAQESHLDTVKLLLAAKADPDNGELDLPLAWAAHNCRDDTAELLLQAGANPNLGQKFSKQVSAPGMGSLPGTPSPYGPYTPLQIAVARNCTKLSALFLKSKADPNATTPAAWFTPVRPLIGYAMSNLDMFKAFLDAGADPDVLKSYGEPLLVAAAGYNSSSERVELLLKKGAKVNVRGNNEYTALHQAAQFSNEKTVEALLAAKAAVDVVNSQGMTPLRLAMDRGEDKIVELLLTNGSGVNRKDEWGSTPLHWAVSGRQKEICELLLKHGANPNVQNNQSQTPLDLAKALLPSGPPPGIPMAPSGAPQQNVRVPAQPAELIALLKQHGALDDLPDFTTIRITRQGWEQPRIVFRAPTNRWNQFTLLETVMKFYAESTYYVNGSAKQPTEVLPFPDLTRITIRRPSRTASGKTAELKANLLNADLRVDCAKDVPLEFGDVVEIPERVHALNDVPGNPLLELGVSVRYPGRSVPLRIGSPPAAGNPEMNSPTTDSGCLFKSVQLVVLGQTTAIKVFVPQEGFLNTLLQKVEARSVLRSSSDLSRVRVTRKKRATGKPQEFIVNTVNTPFQEILWLQDGDVIEVPDKP